MNSGIWSRAFSLEVTRRTVEPTIVNRMSKLQRLKCLCSRSPKERAAQATFNTGFCCEFGRYSVGWFPMKQPVIYSTVVFALLALTVACGTGSQTPPPPPPPKTADQRADAILAQMTIDQKFIWYTEAPHWIGGTIRFPGAPQDGFKATHSSAFQTSTWVTVPMEFPTRSGQQQRSLHLLRVPPHGT